MPHTAPYCSPLSLKYSQDELDVRSYILVTFDDRSFENVPPLLIIHNSHPDLGDGKDAYAHRARDENNFVSDCKLLWSEDGEHQDCLSSAASPVSHRGET